MMDNKFFNFPVLFIVSGPMNIEAFVIVQSITAFLVPPVI